MKISSAGQDLITRFEGFSPVIYTCPAGYKTIGFGHVVRKDEEHMFSEPIDKNIGASLLDKDLAFAERSVMRLISHPVSQAQFDSLVSFTFNLGSGSLQRSTLRSKLNRGDILGASDEFCRWVWSGGRKLRGLVLRRQAEKSHFMMDDRDLLVASVSSLVSEKH